MLNSISHTKFRNDRMYITAFVGYKFEIGWNIYMEAISKSEPIFSKFGSVIFMPNSISHTKFRKDRIYITGFMR